MNRRDRKRHLMKIISKMYAKKIAKDVLICGVYMVILFFTIMILGG